MPAKGTSYTDGVLDLVFLNTALSLIGDAAGLQPSASAGSLYISLHTANPLPSSSQATNEISYTGYSRVPVARSGAGWVRTGESVSPVGAITFGACTAGSGTASHFGVGTAGSGAGKLLYAGTVTPNIAVAAGVTPQLTTATAITES